jgi:hypothetical protein
MKENRYRLQVIGHRGTIKCSINIMFIVSNTSAEAVNENNIMADNACFGTMLMVVVGVVTVDGLKENDNGKCSEQWVSRQEHALNHNANE